MLDTLFCTVRYEVGTVQVRCSVRGLRLYKRSVDDALSMQGAKVFGGRICFSCGLTIFGSEKPFLGSHPIVSELLGQTYLMTFSFSVSLQVPDEDRSGLSR
jgi:hypothetical protein